MRNARVILFCACAALGAGSAGFGLAGAGASDEARLDGAEQHARTIRWSGALLVQLHVADLDRSIAFYCETLGLELESRNDAIKWARVKPGIPGVTIGLGEAPPDEVKGSGGATINLGVGDLDGARALLESRGVKFLGPTVEIPGVVRLAEFHDPDGHRIKLAGHSARR